MRKLERPSYPAKKSRREGPAYNREWEVVGKVPGSRIGSLYRRTTRQTRGKGRARTGKQIRTARRGRGEMTKTPGSLQELRRRIYRKAKSEPQHRFWGFSSTWRKSRPSRRPTGWPEGKAVPGSTPTKALVKRLNAQVAGWVNYFRVGNSSRAFSEIRDYLEMKVRTFLTRRKRRRKTSVGWRRWSNEYLYGVLGLYWDWKLQPLGSATSYA